MDKDPNYYKEHLNSQLLYKVYETDIPQVSNYLKGEIDFIKSKLSSNEKALELGCGYGRILKSLCPHAEELVGIDISEDNIKFGREYLSECENVKLLVMDAHEMDYKDEFDVILSLQNGLSSMKGDTNNIIKRCIDALKTGGSAYFSTYSDKFWDSRLKWFEEQADKGLLGPIDYERTKDGVIVCEDGFTAKTFNYEDLRSLAEQSGCDYEIEELNGQSLFLIITK